MDPRADHDVAQQLLAAWVLHVCEPDEAQLVERHLRSCDQCTADVADLTESAGDLASLAPVEPPPPDVWEGIAAAIGTAPARGGRAIDPYNELVVQLADLLAELGPDDWTRAAAGGWSVLDLVAHLAAVDGVLMTALRTRTPAPADLDERTAEAIGEARRRPPAETVTRWRRQAADIAVAVTTGGADLLARQIPFAGIELPVRTVLLDRAFETWIHADDIAAATGRRFPGPPPAHITMLADTAVGLLPGVLAMTGRSSAGTAAVTLTGPGGGSWQVPLGDSDGARVVELTMDVMDFCYLVGGRRELSTVPRQARGDGDRADDLLFAAAALARP